MIIAIDGPAASGKGTLGKRLAKHYGYRHLDTGVIYRAVAKALMDAGADLTDEMIAVSAALALDPVPKVLWMQLSVRDDAAAARAEARGVQVVMNRCPKIEYGRLSGEIKWSGVNSRIISSRKTTAGAGFQRLTLGPR